MASDNYLAAVARELTSKLHSGATGGRCRCGACRHVIAATARRIGVSAERLKQALPAEGSLERKPRGRAPLTARVEQVATISVSGHRQGGLSEALRLLAGR